MQMSIHPNEDLLHQIFRFFPVTDRPVHKVQKTSLITSHQFREGALLSPEECSYDSRVIHRLQALPDGLSFDRDNLLTDDVSHSSLLYIETLTTLNSCTSLGTFCNFM